MDGIQHQAVISLSHNGNPAFQFLFLTTPNPANCSPAPCFSSKVWDSPAGQISEDPGIDPLRHLLLSPDEGLNGLTANYEIADISKPQSLLFYENPIGNQMGFPNGSPDSAAEDCSALIALASIEYVATPRGQVSTPFIADLHTPPATFTPNLPAGMWTDPIPNSQFVPLAGSYLSPANNNNVGTGPIAVAQGGSVPSHEGVLGMEFGGNTITAFRLNVPPFTAPGGSNPPFADWVTCNLGTDPQTGVLFSQGYDPHTVTAYQSPNAPNHSFALLANTPPADTLAVVDLDLMLGTVHRYPGTNVCSGGINGTPGTLPASVVTFVKVR
jgi:hypothetical protein